MLCVAAVQRRLLEREAKVLEFDVLEFGVLEKLLNLSPLDDKNGIQLLEANA